MTVLLKAALSLMDPLFREAEFDNKDKVGAFACCIPTRSPAYKLPERFFTLIEDDANAFLTPLLALGTWTPRLMLYVFTVCGSFAAQIYLRFVFSFEE